MQPRTVQPNCSKFVTVKPKMCIQTDIWNCIASHRNKVKRTLSKRVLSKSNRWAVVNCNVMANSFDAVCIIRIYMFLKSTWARFCFAVLFFHDFQWIQKKKRNETNTVAGQLKIKKKQNRHKNVYLVQPPDRANGRSANHEFPSEWHRQHDIQKNTL